MARQDTLIPDMRPNMVDWRVRLTITEVLPPSLDDNNRLKIVFADREVSLQS